MSPAYQPLTNWQVAFAAALILVNGAISIGLKLKLEKQLAIAAVRTAVQLTLVGFVLEFVFQFDRLPVIATMMLTMTIIAGLSSLGRSRYRYRGIRLNSIASVWSSSWIILAITLSSIVRVAPWYDPQYAIPLLGMILGNTLNGISLGLDRMQNSLAQDRNRIETLLSLGATRWEAARDSVRDAIRTGMIPIINSMSVVGIVSLPGMMTGQLLSGVTPLDAIRYQIVIMFLIASATALGTMLIVLLTYRRLFTDSHQLAADRLTRID